MLKSLLLATALVTSSLAGSSPARAQESSPVYRLQLPGVLLFSGDAEPDALTAAMDQPPSGTSQIGEFFTTQLSGSGGTPPYSVVPGSQPSGWTISGNTLAGTYTVMGDLAFTVVVRDSAVPPQTAPVSFSTTVVDEFPLAASLGSGVFFVNEVVNRPGPTVAGNDGAAGFMHLSGQLPPGLALAGDGALTGTVSAANGAAGTAVIRVSDSHSHIDVDFPWSVSGPSAANTVPIGSLYMNGASWSTIGDYPGLRDGNLATPIVNTAAVVLLILDLGASVEGNTISVAANHGFTFRAVSSNISTSYNSWGTTHTYTPGNGPMTINLGATHSHRYVGIQILTASGPGNIVGITELRYGKDGILP